MKIRCENPTLIFNPNLVWLFSVHCHRAVLGDQELSYPVKSCFYNFPWRDFYRARTQVTQDNIDDFYLIDNDGVTFPVFMYVPCGKCRLCLQKKTSDWETRCICESASSPYTPLFITLTYRPDVRPDNMQDCYDDFQKFMKRLRINVARDLGENRELRYLAVSEWTPKNHYPHIHMLLWNMPFIAQAEGDKNSFQSLCKYIQDDAWQNGIAKVEFCRDCSGAYVLKYMSKGMDPDCWMRASRRNGIGYKFAMSLLPQICRCPDMTSFTVPVTKRDRKGNLSTSYVTKGFPAYFKRILFPTLSNLFPSVVSKAAKDFMLSATKLHYTISTFGSDYMLSDIVDMVSQVSQKYGIMHIDFNDATPPKEYMKLSTEFAHKLFSYRKAVPDRDLRRHCVYIKTEVVDGLLCPVRVDSMTPVDGDYRMIQTKTELCNLNYFAFCADVYQDFVTLQESFAILMKYQFDVNKFLSRLELTNSHKEYVRSMIDELPDFSIDNLVDAYERDQRWIDTHWRNKELSA